MAHWLKVLRTLVKITSVIVSIAFLINSVNGIMSTIELADGQTIQQQTVQPGDFEINFAEEKIDVGVDFDNTLFYDLEDIIIHMVGIICVNDSKSTEHNVTVLDLWTNGEDNGESKSDVEGRTIESGESSSIDIIAGDAEIQMESLFSYVGFDPLVYPTWDLADFISNPSLSGLLNTTFSVYLSLDFSVSYAFGQYDISVSIDMLPETFNLGLGI